MSDVRKEDAMFRRKFDLLVAVLALSHTGFAAWSSEPRKSPELTLTQPSGTETRLSSFKGKVIAIEFLFVRSPHCLQLAEMLNKLNNELGPQGFQPLAVAFGPNAEPGVLTHLMDYFKITYPVGYTTTEKVDAYLARQEKEVLKIPQIVIVDRHGFIRACSGRNGDPALEHESSLRDLIKTLLNESQTVPRGAKARLDTKSMCDHPASSQGAAPCRLSGTGRPRRISL